MPTIKITNLTTGSPKGTDEIPAVDVTDTTQDPTGTTKKYIRSDVLNYFLQALSLTTYNAVLVATTANLTATYNNGSSGVNATLTNNGAQAVLEIDGVTVSVNDRVLVKNQASQAQNGIYTVTNVGSSSTNWILTRATDFDQPAEIIQYAVVFVNDGTINGGLLYQQTEPAPFTIGTTDIVFALFTTQSISFPITLAEGGTSSVLTASNGGVLFSNATALQMLSGTATANQVLLSGANSPGNWSTATYPATTTINGILYSSSANTISQLSSITGGVLITDASSVPQWLLNPTDTGRILSSVNGDSSVWTDATYPVSTTVNEILYSSANDTVSGLTTANSAMLYTDNSGVPQFSASLADGEIMIGATGASPSPATLTAGAGISINNTANSIEVSASGSGIGWNNIAGTTQNAAVDSGYICQNAATTTVTLPATAAIGSTVIVEGLGAGGWVLAANTGQTIQIGSSATTSAGSLTSATATDNVTVICIVANTTWRVQTTNSAGLTIA